ncbi:MAG TPA: acyltransferase [Bacteroidales bacterium]|nr:acyltransferase [Bacteroidales bacterium]
MEAVEKQIFQIQSESDFQAIALKIFHFQYKNCPIYQQYVKGVVRSIDTIKEAAQIPFLPIDFFKTHRIISSEKQAEIIFKSSGTTATQVSHHHVAKLSVYEESLLGGFRYFIGEPQQFAILAYLPSYREHNNSSLLYMLQLLMQKSKHPLSGFYFNKEDELIKNLQLLHNQNTKTILWGVSFALLDLIEKYKLHFPHLLVFETGGMKGKRKEILREELHQRLKKGFGVDKIYSEYGMAELLSQAYSTGNQTFKTPLWMRVYIRDIYNPLHVYNTHNKRGGINIIDLANLYSCSFIATQDMGIIRENQSFEVLGRFDYSDIRGCNLLVEE